MSRPDARSLIGKDPRDVPMSLQRIVASDGPLERVWIGPEGTAALKRDFVEEYAAAHDIMKHLCVQAPTKHKSGHPGGPLSAFTFAYFVTRRRNPTIDAPLYYSAGHLSLLAYGLQWMFRRGEKDPRLASPQSIIDCFRRPDGLPGHVEAGIGDIPFGTGPLGKGVSVALGCAFGRKYLKQKGIVDVVLADGDAQEGQVMEAFRLASHLGIDNLVVHGDFNDIQLSGMPSKTVAADFAALAQAAGWQVIEVQNGNDPAQVCAALDAADGFIGKGRPIFVCYYTTMGNGIPFLEKGSNDGSANYHGSPLKEDIAAQILKELPTLDDAVKRYEEFRKQFSILHFPFSIAQAVPSPAKTARTITKEKGAARTDFGAIHLKAMMKTDARIVVLHADLAGSGGFDKVAKDFPDRVINVGVAEANMYMMAAGMRQAGLLPITYTFAAFGTSEARASARLIDVNCGHTRCGVLHDCTHAGLSVGEDGETHQERNYFNIPLDHTQVWMPVDTNQSAAMAERGLEIVADGSQSVYVFFPRSGHPQLLTSTGEPLYGAGYVYDGRMDLVRGGGKDDQVTIIATGVSVHDAVAVADALALTEDKIRVRVLNASCIRPLDAAAVAQAALETTHIVVVEDHHSEGGLASQVADLIADFQLPCSLRRLGANHYFPSATADELKFLAGLDRESIEQAVLDEMSTEVSGSEDALISALFSMRHHLTHSRFRDAMRPFIDRLLKEKDYLERLRSVWAKRFIDPEKLPNNKRIRAMLGEVQQ
jgi:transketolase